MQPHRGTLILVFGILGVFCCAIFGIMAWVLGSSDLRGMDLGRVDPSGRGLTLAGKILGIIGVVCLIFQIVLTALVTILFTAVVFFSEARST